MTNKAKEQAERDEENRIACILKVIDDVSSCATSESNPDSYGPIDKGDALVACSVLARAATIILRGGP